MYYNRPDIPIFLSTLYQSNNHVLYQPVLYRVHHLNVVFIQRRLPDLVISPRYRDTSKKRPHGTALIMSWSRDSPVVRRQRNYVCSTTELWCDVFRLFWVSTNERCMKNLAILKSKTIILKHILNSRFGLSGMSLQFAP